MGAVSAATELVPLPDTGRRFTATKRVQLGDVDRHGRLRFDGVARQLQDVANEDAVDSGLANAVSWVVRRTLVATEQVPVLGEHLTLTTFCSGTGRSWAERRTSIRGDRGGCVEAVSLWVQIDPATERIRALDGDFHRVYGGAANRRRVSARLSLPGVVAGIESRPWALRAVDVDPLGHVNNAILWAILEEALVDCTTDRIGIAEIEYLAPVDATDSPAALHVARSSECTAWLVAGDVVRTVARWTPNDQMRSRSSPSKSGSIP